MTLKIFACDCIFTYSASSVTNLSKLTTDVSAIQLITFAVEHIAKISLWAPGKLSLSAPPLSTGLHQNTVINITALLNNG